MSRRAVSSHPTILAWDNRLISPDYPGTLRRTVESIAGGTCLFFQGSAGNQDTVRDYSCRPEDARWIGRQIGIEAARVAEQIETQPTERHIGKYVESSWTMGVVERVAVQGATAKVGCVSRIVPMPVWKCDPPSGADIAHVQDLEKHLADLRVQRAPEEKIREANMHVRRASLDLSIRKRRSQNAQIAMEFQAIRLGDTALVGIPVEPFAEIGFEVKSRSPFATTFFSGYTNGVESYMAMPQAFEEGGYEVWMTPFSPDAPSITVEESLKLLNELHAT